MALLSPKLCFLAWDWPRGACQRCDTLTKSFTIVCLCVFSPRFSHLMTGGVPMAYFGILWYIPQLFRRFSIYQSIPKYTKIYQTIKQIWYTLVYFGIYHTLFWDFPYTKVYQSIPKYAMGTPPFRSTTTQVPYATVNFDKEL
eukprot:sb/3474143/